MSGRNRYGGEVLLLPPELFIIDLLSRLHSHQNQFNGQDSRHPRARCFPPSKLPHRQEISLLDLPLRQLSANPTASNRCVGLIHSPGTT